MEERVEGTLTLLRILQGGWEGKNPDRRNAREACANDLRNSQPTGSQQLCTHLHECIFMHSSAGNTRIPPENALMPRPGLLASVGDIVSRKRRPTLRRRNPTISNGHIEQGTPPAHGGAEGQARDANLTLLPAVRY